jgi:hypothetical protein
MGADKTPGHRRSMAMDGNSRLRHARENSGECRAARGQCATRIFRAITRENAAWRYLGVLAGPFYQPGWVVGRWRAERLEPGQAASPIWPMPTPVARSSPIGGSADRAKLGTSLWARRGHEPGRPDVRLPLGCRHRRGQIQTSACSRMRKTCEYRSGTPRVLPTAGKEQVGHARITGPR